MHDRLSRLRCGWPAVPRTAKAWIALPEVPLGRHLLADVGWVSSARDQAESAGIGELPSPRARFDDGYVALPAVTVVGDDQRMRMFRLPISYADAVKRFARADTDVGGDPALAGVRALLPCHFLIGDRETVFLVPDDSSRSGRLN